MTAVNIPLLATFARRSVDQIADAQRVIDVIDLTHAEEERWQGIIEDHQWALSEIQRLVPDEQLLAAYQRTDGEPGNPEADALAAELRRRNIDF